jgi:tRNA wybutosine-synthesizing protein 4
LPQTNNSSIVSKRSVEKLYYPDEPHFFRYFVRKFQRRAPLINRGYWLRLRAIDVLVRDFLRKGASEEGEARGRSKRRVVVNLGCGRSVFLFSSSFLLFTLRYSPYLLISLAAV